MGNGDSKPGNSNPETLKNQAVFRSLSKNKPTLSRNEVEKAWSGSMDLRLNNLVLTLLFPSDRKGLDFDTYNDFATVVTKGNYSEKADVLLQLIATDASNEEDKLYELVLAVISSAVQIQRRTASKAIVSWTKEQKNEADFTRLSGYCLKLAGGGKTEYTSRDITAMLEVLDGLMSCVFTHLLGSDRLPITFFPRWVRLRGDTGKDLEQCSLLTLEDILFLNLELPVDWQQEWRLLFSTKIHGESFSRLSGQIVNQGPTLLIIRDKDEHVFGGFAPDTWTLNPNFVGDASSFLFSLRPHMDIYPASNFNENFQYLNQGQQTLPNGLGMGGRLEYFGVWLDSEFGKGLCNDSCTTFRHFTRLSKQKEFLCADVEVWGVGQPPPTASELGERSVLDGNTEAKALLELAGRKTYSDGLREEPKD